MLSSFLTKRKLKKYFNPKLDGDCIVLEYLYRNPLKFKNMVESNCKYLIEAKTKLSPIQYLEHPKFRYYLLKKDNYRIGYV